MLHFINSHPNHETLCSSLTHSFALISSHSATQKRGEPLDEPEDAWPAVKKTRSANIERTFTNALSRPPTRVVEGFELTAETGSYSYMSPEGGVAWEVGVGGRRGGAVRGTSDV